MNWLFKKISLINSWNITSCSPGVDSPKIHFENISALIFMALFVFLTPQMCATVNTVDSIQMFVCSLLSRTKCSCYATLDLSLFQNMYLLYCSKVCVCVTVNTRCSSSWEQLLPWKTADELEGELFLKVKLDICITRPQKRAHTERLFKYLFC